ncbi:hypothetical protein JXB41_05500 [Candidatus Woesearchaeota archaeon]|nr:hypothetical protein [Candidatus Woesearchaeota archaeon]
MSKYLKNVPAENTFKIGDKEIRNIEELLSCLKIMGNDEFRNYVGENYNHFQNWIRDIIQDMSLAESMFNIKTKEELVDLIEKRINLLKKEMGEITKPEKQTKAAEEPSQKPAEEGKEKTKATVSSDQKAKPEETQANKPIEQQETKPESPVKAAESAEPVKTEATPEENQQETSTGQSSHEQETKPEAGKEKLETYNSEEKKEEAKDSKPDELTGKKNFISKAMTFIKEKINYWMPKQKEKTETSETHHLYNFHMGREITFAFFIGLLIGIFMGMIIAKMTF